MTIAGHLKLITEAIQLAQASGDSLMMHGASCIAPVISFKCLVIVL